MGTILLILSILNFSLALLAYLSSFVETNTKSLQATSSIALSSTNRRKVYALILGLLACLWLIINPNKSPIVWVDLLAILTNFLAIIISYLAQASLTRKLRNTHANQSVAVISLEKTSLTPVELWLKKSDCEWPPINLEIGMGPWVVGAKGLNAELLEKLKGILQSSNLLLTPNLKENLKQVLNSHGVTHPMDIEGANCLPELQEFFEQTLLKDSNTQ